MIYSGLAVPFVGVNAFETVFANKLIDINDMVLVKYVHIVIVVFVFFCSCFNEVM
jgi:hypothetical protein